MRHSARATRALQALAEADPAFAALALWVDHRDADAPAPGQTATGVGRPDAVVAPLDDGPEAPAWTDGKTIYYGPAFEALPSDQQVGIAAHQILHVALCHPARDRALRLRLGPRLPGPLFNVAADALVNETLLAAGYAIPRPAVTLSRLMPALRGKAEGPMPALAKWDAEALTLALLEAEGQGRTATRGEGDAPVEASAALSEASRARFAPDLQEDATNTEVGGQEDEAESAAEWRQRLARALDAGRMAGRGIGALGFRLADLPRSDVPWERHLRHLAARALLPGARPSWARPARRWTAMEAAARGAGARAPVFEPGQARAVAVPRLALGLDASASIDAARLGMLAAQAAGIARRSAAELHLIVFDDGVRLVTDLPLVGTEAALSRIDLPRGGGTDYAELFERTEMLAPALLIVLTDLDAPLPPRPKVELLWAVSSPPARVPAYGRVLDLSL